MSEIRLVPIYSTTNLARAEVIRASLEADGIRCEIENEHQAGMTGVFEVRLFVTDSDEAAARRFITEHENQNTGDNDNEEEGPAADNT